MNLEELVGRTLVFGIPGTRARPADVRLFRETHAGGLILYRINFESPAQTRRLIRDLEESLGRRLLVAVDHEGGRVVMFQRGVTVFPDNLAFGQGGYEADARLQGEIEARELRRLGVDLNFSPVADVLTDAFSPNIGIRSYGKDPGQAGGLAAARIRAMQEEGLSACVKHFPGLGPASLDPHLQLPVISCGWKEMERTHLPPFLKAIEAGVDAVMSSHPLYPRLDPSPRTPATFSRRLINGLLRDELGFGGVIVSDDLEMGALRRLCSVGRAAVRAAAAGHDLLLVCHGAENQRRAHRALLEAYRNRELSTDDLEKSAARLRALENRRAERFAAGAPRAEPEGAALALGVARRAVSVTGTLPSLDGASLNVVFPRLSALGARIMVEPELEKEAAFIKRRLKGHKGPKKVHIVPLDSRNRESAKAVASAKEADVTVYFCYDAHLDKTCKRLLEALQKAAKKLILVLLRDPYDREYAEPGTAVVTAYGWRVCQIRACLEKILGKASSVHGP